MKRTFNLEKEINYKLLPAQTLLKCIIVYSFYGIGDLGITLKYYFKFIKNKTKTRAEFLKNRNFSY